MSTTRAKLKQSSRARRERRKRSCARTAFTSTSAAEWARRSSGRVPMTIADAAPAQSDRRATENHGANAGTNQTNQRIKRIRR
nr:hypothetical protein WG70_26875 [Burkholderia oklahomensis EO147]